MSDQDFRIRQLTKELVSAKLGERGEPCAIAADLVRRTLEVALQGLALGAVAESRVVEDACQGAMTGLLLHEKDLAKGAVLILDAVVDLAGRLNVDGTEMMRSAMRGIADMRRFSGPAVLSAIEAAIELEYQGAGSAFRAILAESSTSMPETAAKSQGRPHRSPMASRRFEVK